MVSSLEMQMILIISLSIGTYWPLRGASNFCLGKTTIIQRLQTKSMQLRNLSGILTVDRNLQMPTTGNPGFNFNP